MTKFPDTPPPSRREGHSKSQEPWDSQNRKKPSKEFVHPKHNGESKQKEFDMDGDINVSPNRPLRPDHSKKPDHGKSKDSHFFLPSEANNSSVIYRRDEKKPDNKKPKEEDDDKEDKKKDIDPQTISQPSVGVDVKSQNTDVKEIKTTEVTPSDAAAAVQKIRDAILRLASSLQTGTVDGKTVQQVDLKTTSEVPSFLQGASVMVTRDAPGRISVSISNLTAANEMIAIKAIESQTAELQKLVRDLAAKHIAITELRIGEHAIVPRIEAPLPSPFASAFEGFNDKRRDPGEGGKGGDKGGGQGEKEGREKQ